MGDGSRAIRRQALREGSSPPATAALRLSTLLVGVASVRLSLSVKLDIVKLEIPGTRREVAIKLGNHLLAASAHAHERRLAQHRRIAAPIYSL